MCPYVFASNYIKRVWNVLENRPQHKVWLAVGIPTMTRCNVCVFLQRERYNENNSFEYFLEQSMRATGVKKRMILDQE